MMQPENNMSPIQRDPAGYARSMVEMNRREIDQYLKQKSLCFWNSQQHLTSVRDNIANVCQIEYISASAPEESPLINDSETQSIYEAKPLYVANPV